MDAACGAEPVGEFQEFRSMFSFALQRLPARPSGVAVLAVLAVALSAGCSSSSKTGGEAASSGQAGSRIVSVVASENFWGNITEQLGGPQVKVTSIISDPNADPHIYESDARDAAAIGSAQLVIENGLGYDDFMTKLLSASRKSSRRVLSIQKALDITGANPNPHIWYDTAKLPQVANAIEMALAEADPADTATFVANAKTFDASLQPLLATIAEIKAKYAGTSISYTERVPGYLVQAAGLVLGTPASFSQAIEDGNDPNPLDTAAFDADITTHKVKVLLYNSQVTDAQTTKIKQLAAAAHVPIVGVSETLPPQDPSFQSWQLRQDKELLAALGG
jgi:zinc/manganese transport system substrate-binding protein